MTQEEIAEAVGVSRGWYRMLESGASVRASPQLLDRLAQALGLTMAERTTLFQLAMPEMSNMQLRADPNAILETFCRLRSMAKRLWTASSEFEAFVDVSERMTDWFDDAIIVQWMRRGGVGLWERHYVLNRGSKLVQSIGEDICKATMSTREHDQFMLYPQVAEAGAVGDASDLARETRQVRLKAYAAHGVNAPDFIHGRVHSRTGLIGGFTIVHEMGHDYSETERAVLGTLAELTSFALP